MQDTLIEFEKSSLRNADVIGRNESDKAGVEEKQAKVATAI